MEKLVSDVRKGHANFRWFKTPTSTIEIQFSESTPLPLQICLSEAVRQNGWLILKLPRALLRFSITCGKFKGRPTDAFFPAVNQMFGGSSQITTTAEHCFVVWTVQNDLITTRSAAVGSWKEPPNIWLTVAKNAFVGWALNFRVRMLLNDAVIRIQF